MPFGLLAREWERTCAECGYTWRVPRSIARRGMRGLSGMGNSGMGVAGLGSARSNPHGFSDFSAAVGARAEQMEGYRICAKCGVDDFTQRPAPRQ